MGKADKVYGLGRYFLGKAAAAQESLMRMEAAIPAEEGSLNVEQLMALVTLAIRVRAKS